MDIIPLHPVKNEARVDSRVLTDKLQNQHKNVLALIDNYKSDFEEFGAVAFKTLINKAFQHVKQGVNVFANVGVSLQEAA